MLARARHLRLAGFALGVASVVSVALVAVRPEQIGEYDYRLLVWNLALAWLPFVFALIVYEGFRNGRGGLFLVGFGALWLLFLPNAPYILTDFIHLAEWDPAPLWFNTLTVTLFAATGLVLGLGSLLLVQTVVAAAFGRLAGWAISVMALGLCSVGIYLGRFLNLNSWDAIVDPRSVLEPIAAQLRHAPMHPRFLAVTVAFTSFLVLSYLLVYAVAQASLALDPRRPTRR